MRWRNARLNGLSLHILTNQYPLRVHDIRSSVEWKVKKESYSIAAIDISKFDSRAEAKIRALQKVVHEKGSMPSADANVNVRLREFNEKLLDGYIQAIKYVSRSRSKDAALYATNLLIEATEYAGEQFVIESITRKESEARMSREEIASQWNDVREIVEKWNDRVLDNSDSDGKVVMMAPPPRKAFIQVLYAWGDSKVRRKGVWANYILKNMASLANTNTSFDVIPDSKCFAIAAKCWSGSSHRQSFDHILELHSLHNYFANKRIDGIVADDPFFLMHSIKSAHNYRVLKQERAVSKWFNRLHRYVMDENIKVNPSEVIIDLTGTYSGIIRGYAKARLKASPKNAKIAIERMHEIHSSGSKLAKVEINQNAYDLLLSCLRDSKSRKYALEAMSIFKKMAKDQDIGVDMMVYDSIPSPSENSVIYCIQSLVNVNDMELVTKHTEYLLSYLQASNMDHSVDTYNAFLFLYSSVFSGREILLSKVDFILRLLEEMSETNCKFKPTSKTWSAVLKAYSAVVGQEVLPSSPMKEKALQMAIDVFAKLENMDGEGGLELSDDCYFHMMKCISNLMEEDEHGTKEKEVISIFRKACKNGLVSAAVLKQLKSSIPKEKCNEIIGSGRLVNGWVENVSSIKALYTDGTKGGPNKHARRKGKSTSKSKQKQRKKII